MDVLLVAIALQVHVYLVYILLVVVLALGWVSLRTGWVAS